MADPESPATKLPTNRVDDATDPDSAAQRPELLQAQVVVQVATLVAAEHDPARRARLLARAAAAVGQGAAALCALDVAAGQLLPMAVIPNGATSPEAFNGAASGITAVPHWLPLPVGGNITGIAAQSGALVMAQNLATDTRFTPASAQAEGALLGCEPVALICVPVMDRDQVLGVLTVAQPAGGAGFALRAVECLQALAAQAALVLALQTHEHDQQTAQTRHIQAQEDERHRIGRDLHDGPVQSIASAAMTVELIDGLLADRPDEARIELRRLYTNLTQAMRDLRGVLFDLRPPALVTAGLAVALRQLVAHFQENAALPIQLVVDLPRRLAPESESTIYLIVREALNNVQKHAQATECAVEAHAIAGQDKLGVVIRDNGAGFDADEVLAHYPRGQSWGLLNMYERARAAGAQFAIRSRPGQGTVVEMIVPLGERPHL